MHTDQNMTALRSFLYRDLRKSYGDVEAVRGIDLEVADRRSIRITWSEWRRQDHHHRNPGRSPSAHQRKSVRARARSGVQRREIKNRIGVCLQATNLPDKMKVHEALDLFDAFYTGTPTVTKFSSGCSCGINGMRIYKSLSGGQKQRVALALALLNDPALLFLDEPTTGLDPQVRHEIHGVIQELKENRRSILITTHYIEEAERLCDRVAIIDAGKIIELGTPREIQQRVLGQTLVEITTNEPMPARCSSRKRSRTKNTLPATKAARSRCKRFAGGRDRRTGEVDRPAGSSWWTFTSSALPSKTSSSS